MQAVLCSGNSEVFCFHTAVKMQVPIMIIFIDVMQGIYNYVPETNGVSRVYTSSVADVLGLQFVLQVMLFHTLNVFCTFILVLSDVFVLCPILPFFL